MPREEPYPLGDWYHRPLPFLRKWGGAFGFSAIVLLVIALCAGPFVSGGVDDERAYDDSGHTFGDIAAWGGTRLPECGLDGFRYGAKTTDVFGYTVLTMEFTAERGCVGAWLTSVGAEASEAGEHPIRPNPAPFDADWPETLPEPAKSWHFEVHYTYWSADVAYGETTATVYLGGTDG